jgi:hypothetical protein
MYTRHAPSEKREVRKDAKKGTFRPNDLASRTPTIEETKEACQGKKSKYFFFSNDVLCKGIKTSGNTDTLAYYESHGDRDRASVVL